MTMILVSAYFPVRRGTARRLGLADPQRRRPAWQDALREREQPVADAIDHRRHPWQEMWTSALRFTRDRLVDGVPVPTHPYPGTDPERQSVGQPGHCEECARFGHVRAHPDLGCGDVGCTVAHVASLECDA